MHHIYSTNPNFVNTEYVIVENFCHYVQHISHLIVVDVHFFTDSWKIGKVYIWMIEGSTISPKLFNHFVQFVKKTQTKANKPINKFSHWLKWGPLLYPLN